LGGVIGQTWLVLFVTLCLGSKGIPLFVLKNKKTKKQKKKKTNFAFPSRLLSNCNVSSSILVLKFICIQPLAYERKKLDGHNVKKLEANWPCLPFDTWFKKSK
jgi:hypothetical protein